MRLSPLARGAAYGLILSLALGDQELVAADGHFVLDMCTNPDPGDSERLATIASAMAFGMLEGQGLGGSNREFCPPNSARVANGQYRNVVCRFIEDHNQLLSQDAYLAIAIALLKSYPCDAKKE